MTTYRSPLCLDIIDSSEFSNQEWVRCSCGHWFTEATLIEFASSREKLSKAQKRFADIRELAKSDSELHLQAIGQGYPPAQASAAPQTTVPMAAPSANNIQASQPAFQPAPLAVKEPIVRRTRNLPTLSTSQWLLTVMAGLIAIALTIFFSVTWEEVPALAKVGVVAVLSVGFSFGAIRAKKYFVALSNVLAIIASATTFIGLQSLSRYEILPKAWADGENTPFVSIMLAIVTAGSLLMGRRFKVWGWLIIAPIGAAVSSILFTYNYLGTLLSDGYNHAGYQIAMLSLAILGVVVVARFTRLKAPVVPELPKAKKDQTEALSKEIEESQYRLGLHNKEQASLSLASRLSIFAILGYLAFLAGSIATQLFPFTKGIAGQDFLGVDPVGLIIAALLWMTGAVLTSRFGGGFTSTGEVSKKLSEFIWITAFSMTAFAVEYSAQWVSGESTLVMLLAGSVFGSVMIFAQSLIKKISEDESARLGSLVGSVVLWSISLSLWLFSEGPKSSVELVTFTTIVSATLLARSAVFDSSRGARIGSAIFFGGLLVFVSTNGSPDLFGEVDQVPLNGYLSFAIALAATAAWNIALTVLRDRVGITSRFVSELQTFGVAGFTFITLLRELSNVLPTTESLDLANLLVVLGSFGLIFMVLALLPSLRAIEDLRKTLAFNSFTLLGSGFLAFVALGSSSNFEAKHFYSLLSSYSLTVITVLGLYGVMARRLLALRAGLIVSSVLALSFQQWSLEWFDEFTNPIFFILILGLSLFIHLKLASRIEESLSSFNRIFYPVAFASLTGFYLLTEYNQSLMVRNLSFAVFVFFGIVHYLTSQGRLVKVQESVRSELGVVALITLTATAMQNIGQFEPESLVKLALLPVLVGALYFITKQSVIREMTVWITSTVLVQFAILSYLSDDSVKTSWVLLVPAVSISLTGVIHGIARRRVAKSTGNREFSFDSRILPIRILGVAFAGLLTQPVLTIYSNSDLHIEIQNWMVPFTCAAYLFVSALFISRRWTRSIISDLDLAVARSVPVIWVIGFAVMVQAQAGSGSTILFDNWSCLYFVGIAALSYTTALIRKSSVQAFAGYAAGLLATFFAVNVNEWAVSVDSIFLTGSIGFFILTTFVLRRIGFTFTSLVWPIMLPASILIALALNPFGILDRSETVTPLVIYIELLISLALAVLALFISRGNSLGENALTRLPMLASAGLLYVNSYRYADYSVSSAETEYKLMVIALVSFAALTIFIRKFHAPIAVVAAVGASVQVAFTAVDVLVRANAGLVDYKSELIGLIAAIAIASVTPTLAGLLPDRFKSIVKQGIPLGVLFVPGALAVYQVVAAEFGDISSFKLYESIALIAGATILLVVGVRLGNLGIALVSGMFLTVTVLPILWQSITQVSDDRTRFELQALFAGLVLYGLVAGIRSTFKFQMNSLLYIGVPSLIALLPTLFGVIGRLGSAAENATNADWTRLAIVLGVSVVFLLLGSVRKLAGFFVPGGIALIVTVVPLLWTRMSSLGSAFIVIGLLLLAALIGFVAVKLEQVKGSARSASKWLRELK